MELVVPKVEKVTVHQEGDQVQLISKGQVILQIPYQAAQAIGQAMYSVGKTAEADDNVEAIIQDQALLTRLGVPIGLSNRPDVLKEAANRAAWDSKLRRWNPPGRAKGIANQTIFGSPTIVRHKRNRKKRPKPEPQVLRPRGLASASAFGDT